MYKRIGAWSIKCFDTLGSTQDYARTCLQSSPHCTVITARHQTSGYGKCKRAWISSPENLAATIILHCNDGSVPSWTSYIACLAVGESLFKLDKHLTIQYRWPNDVLINAKKVSGILLERTAEGTLLIGIGINTKYGKPLEQFNGTALDSCGIVVEPLILLENVLNKMQKFCNSSLDFGFPLLRVLWKKRAYKLGQHIVVKQHDKVIAGIFHDISTDGALMLLKENGKILRLYSADILW